MCLKWQADRTSIIQKSYCGPNLIRESRMFFLFTGPPTILVKPQSQQVKAGGIASFYCTAEGAPPPQIHWRKNGKKISRKSMCTFTPSSSSSLSPIQFASLNHRHCAGSLRTFSRVRYLMLDLREICVSSRFMKIRRRDEKE